jgi:release factor glutamine methyltransferase
MRVYGPLTVRHIRSERRWRWRGLRLVAPIGVFHPGLFFSSGVLADHIERSELLGRRVLDVGCGSGLLSLAAARAGAIVTAIDINPAAVGGDDR